MTRIILVRHGRTAWNQDRIFRGTAREVLALFRGIVDEGGLTLLIASHDPLVDEYVDRVLHLKDGKIAPD